MNLVYPIYWTLTDWCLALLICVLLLVIVRDALRRVPPESDAGETQLPEGWVALGTAFRCPVNHCAFVEVERRCGTREAGHAWAFDWKTQGRSTDIVAYREVN